jgi:hypothetical protein
MYCFSGHLLETSILRGEVYTTEKQHLDAWAKWIEEVRVEKKNRDETWSKDGG